MATSAILGGQKSLLPALCCMLYHRYWSERDVADLSRDELIDVGQLLLKEQRNSHENDQPGNCAWNEGKITSSHSPSPLGALVSTHLNQCGRELWMGLNYRRWIGDCNVVM